jgi:hypothetical protein
MIVDRKDLEGKKMSELKQLIVVMGGDPSQPNELKDHLIDRIVLQSAIQPQQPVDSDIHTDTPAEEKTYPTCTIDEVIRAVNPFILRGMKVFHDREGGTWLFRVRKRDQRYRDTNTGQMITTEVWAEDSGTLHQPLKNIRSCASTLMQGALNPAELPKPASITDSYTAVA